MSSWRARTRSVLLRAAMLAAAWWALGEGDTPVGFGVVVVLLALGTSLILSSRSAPWQPFGAILFAFHFVVGSIRGGVDVARRAFARELRLSPTMVTYRSRMPPGPGCNLLAGAVSLMPGTLCVSIDEPELELHVLSDDTHVLRSLEQLEAVIARAVGSPLKEPHA